VRVCLPCRLCLTATGVLHASPRKATVEHHICPHLRNTPVAHPATGAHHFTELSRTAHHMPVHTHTCAATALSVRCSAARKRGAARAKGRRGSAAAGWQAAPAVAWRLARTLHARGTATQHTEACTRLAYLRTASWRSCFSGFLQNSLARNRTA